MRLADVDKMAADESEAYMRVQLSQSVGDITKAVNEVVHKKIQQLIADAPTVDAVPVVRCKDCMHWERSNITMQDGRTADWGFCESNLDPDSELEKKTAENDFCSFGERKD